MSKDFLDELIEAGEAIIPNFAERIKPPSGQVLQEIIADPNGLCAALFELVQGPLQLSIPVDGQGLRVQVSVEPSKVHLVPHVHTIVHNGVPYAVSLRASGDYQEYKL